MKRAPCRSGQTESVREKFKENARRAAVMIGRACVSCRVSRPELAVNRRYGRLSDAGRLAGDGQSLGRVRGSPKRARSPPAPKRVSPQTRFPRSVSTTRPLARQTGAHGSAR